MTIDEERLLVTSVQILADVCAGRTKDKIKWIVTEHLKESNQTHKFKNCNPDDFGLSRSQGDTKIKSRCGIENTWVQVADVDKAYYTINYCCNSLGEFLPPYIIFKSLHL